MKYALVNNQRQEAQSGLTGICPICKSSLLAKCGTVRINHWAHRGKLNCDPWWENETEWHRAWKDEFPKDWQEYIQCADSGEKHIADIKTDQGWVLEFQHSKIDLNELKAREAFYQKLIWIVDGTRRKRDKVQFFEALKNGKLIAEQINLWRIPFLEECTLLREWSESRVPVFFDFPCSHNPKEDQLWCLMRVFNGMAYIGPFSRIKLIEYHSPEARKTNLDFAELLKKLHMIINKFVQGHQHGASNHLESMLRDQECRYKERQFKKRF